MHPPDTRPPGNARDSLASWDLPGFAGYGPGSSQHSLLFLCDLVIGLSALDKQVITGDPTGDGWFRRHRVTGRKPFSCF